MRGTTVATFVLLVIFLLIIGPIITIWALNTLFPALAIPYNFFTWLAVIIVGGALRGNVKVDRS